MANNPQISYVEPTPIGLVEVKGVKHLVVASQISPIEFGFDETWKFSFLPPQGGGPARVVVVSTSYRNGAQKKSPITGETYPFPDWGYSVEAAKCALENRPEELLPHTFSRFYSKATIQGEPS